MTHCPACSAPVAVPVSGSVVPVTCAGCLRTFRAVALPAAERSIEVRRMTRLAAAGENTCFYCPQKAADTVCELCGSFTCGDCEVDWFGRRLCLSCLHAKREQQPDLHFRSRLTLHDNVALMLLLLPLVCIPFYGAFFSALLAPISLFLVFRHWNSPRGMVPRGRFRQIATILLSVALVVGAISFIALIVAAMTGAFDQSSSLP